MPQWNDPPAQSLENALGEAWASVTNEISDNPPFEDVAGVSLEDLTKHAAQAVASLATDPGLMRGDVEALVQLYCMGFVVGSKYGEQRAEKKNLAE